MAKAKNILFIMCDQLRQDYLSCYGHKSLQTPYIDALAKRGIRFDNAYCNAPLCGPSRASFYTGRYQSSHGVMGNEDATQLGEKLLGDYLRPLGYRTAVVGKTHNQKSKIDMAAANIPADSTFAKYAASGGFEPYEWHEGLFPDQILPENQGYKRYLNSVGYTETNPWNSRANSGIDSEGNLHSGWALKSSAYPAAIAEEHSETAFSTRRAVDFIEETGEQPWCLHLSYIKPHWPVIAPSPYHEMYSAKDVQPAIRGDRAQKQHPVIDAFMQLEYSQSYATDETRDVVIPAYMALVKQIDDHIGYLVSYLTEKDLLDSTLIVLTADHGDYLGDHWLGEKDLFHRPSVKIPMIVVDPNQQADITRGSASDKLVEAIDLVPTFVEFAGGKVCHERIEGRSLIPVLQSNVDPLPWRQYAISEIDYSERGAREILDIEPYQCRATMIANHQWKFIYYLGFQPQLFDLQNDPDELFDLGEDPQYEAIRQKMMEGIFHWQYSLKRRVGLDYDYVQGQGPVRDEEFGIIIGRW